MNPTQLLVVFFGGGVGSIARYAVSQWLQGPVDKSYPLGTIVVNLLGAFAFGVLFAMFEARGDLSPLWRLLVLSGFLGAFTTFSTLMFEVGTMISTERAGWALLHLLLHNFVGFGCAVGGLWLGRNLS